MKQYNVTGMSCAACVARVEKAVQSVEGVENCAVSLLTNSMSVEGDVSETAVIKAVTDAGYGASVKKQMSSTSNKMNYEDELEDTQTPALIKRLIASLILLVPLMYVSMGHMLFMWPLPAFLDGNHVAMGIYELILTGLIMVINQKFFISGFKGLIHRAPNMDTLVALGATASFAYSVYALFAMTSALVIGDESAVMMYMDEFYFESAAMILTLITVGKTLEARSKGKTTDAIKSLMKLAPKTANIKKGDEVIEVAIEQVSIGDYFVVKPGENIPVDGIVVEGSSAVNESALTGESIPVDKEIGDKVSAATLNQSGYIVCEATRVGEDTTLAQIIQMVTDAATTKAPIAKVADKVSGIFVPAVITISAITFVIWMLVGEEFGFSLARAISVLVISCPCALGLATPVAIMVGNGVGAKSGIMFKTAVSLEETGKAQIVCLDKTGTITKGEPIVTDIIPVNGTLEELLLLAYSIEAYSEHPLAKAIVQKAEETGLLDKKLDVSDFHAEVGNGLRGVIAGETIVGGNEGFLSGIIKQSADGSAILNEARQLSEQGKTPLYFAKGNELLGLIAVADVVKDDSVEAIEELKDMGIHVVMLTGDNAKTAKAIGDISKVDEVVADVKPDGKEEVIRRLKEHGKVVMVGDGINDAPALTRADIGIAIGAGTDIAIDAADIVLMKSNLKDVAAAIRLSKKTLKNIHENLFWAFIYNIIGIPLAAGLWIPIFGWKLNPMFGAAAMSLSSFCVVTNALRLNLLNIYDRSRAGRIKNSIGNEPILDQVDTQMSEDLENNNILMEENKMEITVKGMMCMHCEAHVKQALEKIDGVTEAAANHDENLVTISTSKEIAEADIKAAVEAAGYEYCGIR